MITVTYHRKDHRLTVDGHAESGEKGHDLVCSAVTALVYTAATALSNDAENGMLRPGTKIDLQKGRAEIACAPARKWDNIVTLQLDTVCAGFDFLAKNLGEFVTYEIAG